MTWDDANRPERIRLPTDRESLNAKFKIYDPNGEHKYYFLAGYYPNGEIGELFIHTSDPGGPVYDALAIVISIALQYGVPWSVIGKKLIAQGFPPAGWTDSEDRDFYQAKSPLDLLAKWMHVRQIQPPPKEIEK